MSDKDESELRSQLQSFTIRDALYIHDKRIDEQKEATHELRRIVGSFEEKFKTLMERINEGVSPTMRRIEAKQGEIEKQIVQVDSKMDVKFAEVQSEIKVMDRHFEGKFVEVDRWMTNIRGILWKAIGWSAIAGLGAAFSTWAYVQQIKSRINAIPTVIETKRK